MMKTCTFIIGVGSSITFKIPPANYQEIRTSSGDSCPLPALPRTLESEWTSLISKTNQRKEAEGLCLDPFLHLGHWQIFVRHGAHLLIRCSVTDTDPWRPLYSRLPKTWLPSQGGAVGVYSSLHHILSGTQMCPVGTRSSHQGTVRSSCDARLACSALLHPARDWIHLIHTEHPTHEILTWGRLRDIFIPPP